MTAFLMKDNLKLNVRHYFFFKSLAYQYGRWRWFCSPCIRVTLLFQIETHFGFSKDRCGASLGLPQSFWRPEEATELVCTDNGPHILKRRTKFTTSGFFGNRFNIVLHEAAAIYHHRKRDYWFSGYCRPKPTGKNCFCWHQRKRLCSGNRHPSQLTVSCGVAFSRWEYSSVHTWL